MFDLLAPENVGILNLLLVVVALIITTIVVRRIVPAIQSNPTYIEYKDDIDNFQQVVTDTVLRLAFTGEDLSDFEEEAEETGRDIRLVAAIYLIDQWTSDRGYDIDEERIVSAVEARLAEMKHLGIVPRADEAAEEAVDAAEDNVFSPGFEWDSDDGAYFTEPPEDYVGLPGSDINEHTGTATEGEAIFVDDDEDTQPLNVVITDEDIADVNERTQFWNYEASGNEADFAPEGEDAPSGMTTEGYLEAADNPLGDDDRSQ